MPTTVAMPARGELERRAAAARASLSACAQCERRCGIDRRRGEDAPCGLGAGTWCYKRHLSLAEEPALLPSYMVYFGACNFRCRFCVQGPTCFAPRRGTRVEPDEAAADFTRAVAEGARTINLVGGEPSMHAHTILEIAARAPEPLPLVLNSNMYMTPEILDLLEGVVTLYLADFKFGRDACAQRLADVSPYFDVVTRNLLRAAETTDLIIRHLVMPGHLECCLRPVAEWVAAHLPHVPFTLMTGYVPAARAATRPELGRCLTTAERAEAERTVAALGLGPAGRSPR